MISSFYVEKPKLGMILTPGKRNGNVQTENFLIIDYFPRIIFISISSLYQVQIALC